LKIAQVVDPFGIDKGFAYVQHAINVASRLRTVKLLPDQSLKTRGDL